MFFTLYKYPLSIMGLGIPLSAIAAAVHRSEETSLQIRATEKQFTETLKQNTFNNYIKHKEEFIELLEKMEVVCDCKFSDPLHLYKQIFPKNNYKKLTFRAHGSHDLNIFPNTFLRELRSNLWEIVAALYDEKSDNEKLIETIYTIHEMTRSLKLSRSTDKQYPVESKKLIWPIDFSQTSFNHLKYITQNLISFSSFEEEDNEKRKNAMALMRLPGSGSNKFMNTHAIDDFTAEIDDYL